MGKNADTSSLLMGDIVGSEHALSPDALHRQFNDAIEAANTRHAQDLVSPLTITLGDEFQGLMTSLVGAMHAARDLRLGLMAQGIDCRFVIGKVTLTTPVNPDRAWNMMGPGFGRAREILNDKKPDVFYRFSLRDAPVTETLLDAIGAGLSRIEQGWTDRQRSDITALLGGTSPADLAQARGVSVHSVYKVRGSGHYDVYAQHWRAIETALAAYDRKEHLG